MASGGWGPVDPGKGRFTAAERDRDLQQVSNSLKAADFEAARLFLARFRFVLEKQLRIILDHKRRRRELPASLAVPDVFEKKEDYIIKELDKVARTAADHDQVRALHALRYAGNTGVHIESFNEWFNSGKYAYRTRLVCNALYACDILGVDVDPTVDGFLRAVAPGVFKEVEKMAEERARQEAAAAVSPGGSAGGSVAAGEEGLRYGRGGWLEGDDDSEGTVSESGTEDNLSTAAAGGAGKDPPPAWRAGAKEAALKALLAELRSPAHEEACDELLDAVPGILGAFNAFAAANDKGTGAGGAAATGAGEAVGSTPKERSDAVRLLKFALESYVDASTASSDKEAK